MAPENRVDIAIAGANLKLLVNSGDITLEQEDVGDFLLRILAGVDVAGADDPWGLRESPTELLVELNLATGALTVPAEEEQNDGLLRAHTAPRTGDVAVGCVDRTGRVLDEWY